MIRCRALPCREPGARQELAFCDKHMAALTAKKRQKVLSIRGLNVLEPEARLLSQSIITECLRYLAGKEERKHANG